MSVLEQIAKLVYQFSELIDDKEIDKRWYELANKERWFDCAEKVASIKDAEMLKKVEEAVKEAGARVARENKEILEKIHWRLQIKPSEALSLVKEELSRYVKEEG